MLPEYRLENQSPNVFRLSESIFKNNEIFSSINGKNLLSVYFGMFVLNDIIDSSYPKCPPSYRKIPFPKKYLNKDGDEVDYYSATPHSFMLLNKIQNCKLGGYSFSKYPTKLNYRNIWIDGEIIYGDSKFCADSLRTFKRGKLWDFTQGDSSFGQNFGRQCFNCNL